MLRIRKEDGTAKIVIRIEKECSVEDVNATFTKTYIEIEEACARMAQNIPHFDEVKIDNNGDMATKRKFVASEKAAAPEK